MGATQVLAAFIRPAPTAPSRKHWNLLHHWLGRLSIIVAWTTVYLGIYIYHDNPVYKVRDVVGSSMDDGWQLSGLNQMTYKCMAHGGCQYRIIT